MTVLAGLLVAGCVNPYAQFYHDNLANLTPSQRAQVWGHVEQTVGEPRLIRSNNPGQDSKRLVESNYGLIGYSGFHGRAIPTYQAIEQAKKVHASVVVIASHYTNTVTNYMPFTQYHPGPTSTTMITGDINAMATTTGSGYTTTSMVPYQVNQYDYMASYWVKLKPGLLGVRWRNLTPALRQTLERNKGVVITAVVNDSPAFNAGLLEGDVVLKVNDEEIPSTELASGIFEKYAGKQVTLTIIRHGQTKTIPVQLNNKS